MDEGCKYWEIPGPILEYASSCWDPYREGQINALDRVQNKAANFAHQRNDSKWKNLGTAERNSSHMRCLESVHGRTGKEGHK
jgi:hypothetical protein